MTSHDDPVDEVDDLPELSAADEAFVRDLLAGLPPVAVPADLGDRLDAALLAAGDEPADAEEDAEPGADGPADDEDLPVSTVGTTVVALDEARLRRHARRTRVLQVAAVSVLVAAGVVGVVKIAGSGRVAQTSTAAGTGAGATAPAVEQALLTTSGHAYSDATLVSDVRALAAHETLPPGPSSSYGTVTPATPSPATSEQGSAVSTPTSTGAPVPSTDSASRSAGIVKAAISRSGLVACLAAVEEGLPEPVSPVAVDQGSYRDQAALVVVLPGALDPSTSYDVFVVGIACGQNADAHLLTYQLVEAH